MVTVLYVCPSLGSVKVLGISDTSAFFKHPAKQIAAATAAVVSMSLRIVVDPLG
jgi:hypothetical protein